MPFDATELPLGARGSGARRWFAIASAMGGNGAIAARDPALQDGAGRGADLSREPSSQGADPIRDRRLRCSSPRLLLPGPGQRVHRVRRVLTDRLCLRPQQLLRREQGRWDWTTGRIGCLACDLGLVHRVRRRPSDPGPSQGATASEAHSRGAQPPFEVGGAIRVVPLPSARGDEHRPLSSISTSRPNCRSALRIGQPVRGSS